MVHTLKESLNLEMRAPKKAYHGMLVVKLVNEELMASAKDKLVVGAILTRSIAAKRESRQSNTSSISLSS